MDQISKEEEKSPLLANIQAVLDDMDTVIPHQWTRAQVGAVLSAYMEFYK